MWVRVDNPRAIAFYEKVGFEGDVGGPVQRDGGAPHLTMRKPPEKHPAGCARYSSGGGG